MVGILDKNDPATITRFRKSLGLTQAQFADIVGVSFVTVNRWENGHSSPSRALWDKLQTVQANHAARKEKDGAVPRALPQSPPLNRDDGNRFSSRMAPCACATADFSGDPHKIRSFLEAERLSCAWQVNPAFATEISGIDPLPHQRIAVYDHMLKQHPLRFLLADDAGAGKTIMCGLYLREMLARKRISRVLIVPPAGLVGNWESELRTLFQLSFTIITGSMLRDGNPFDEHDFAICSIDTLRGKTGMARLAGTRAYDLAVFDEAHKLGCDINSDRTIRMTGRYRTAAAIAGAGDDDLRKALPWHARNLLLLTATPHMGKDYPYIALWTLLEPDLVTGEAAFEQLYPSLMKTHFIRRTKEEMVSFDGKPLFPMRMSSTLGFRLSPGELELYENATDYMRNVYNQAQMLNNQASQLALSVFQRRLASSTYALMRSFERREKKLEELLEKIQSSEDSLASLRKISSQSFTDEDTLYSTPMDEAEEGQEPDEAAEEQHLAQICARNVEDLVAEIRTVHGLAEQARAVWRSNCDSKFDKLKEIFEAGEYRGEKLLIFTEHRDTLDFLTRRFEALGYTGRIASIHGGMDYKERQKQIACFRDEDAQVMICTDAAAEGVNLQFCWIMINYDIPWNPARLEQRMGRVHRYGQKKDKVILLNLVASNTREGRVLETLLGKLELIRRQLNSDKVFDSIGVMVRDVSIVDWMTRLIADPTGASVDKVIQSMDSRITEQQVAARKAEEQQRYGDGGDVRMALPRLKSDMDLEYPKRLLPGYTEGWLAETAPLLGLDIEGELHELFRLRSRDVSDCLHSGLWEAIRESTDKSDPWFSLRMTREAGTVWVHPGEPVFDALHDLVRRHFRKDVASGAFFLDAAATTPYLLCFARTSIARNSGEGTAETLEDSLVGVRVDPSGAMARCDPEKLLVLDPATGDLLRAVHTPEAENLLERHAVLTKGAEQWLLNFTESRAEALRTTERAAVPGKVGQLHLSLSDRKLDFFDRQKALKASMKKDPDDAILKKEYEKVRRLLKEHDRKARDVLKAAQDAPEAIHAKAPEMLACVLVVPYAADIAGAEFVAATTEAVAMNAVIAWEESQGGRVTLTDTPAHAVQAGLESYPGFDLMSVRQDGVRYIEVKGTSRRGRVHLTENEWRKAGTLQQDYWLYVVYDCDTPTPRVCRVRDPLYNLFFKAYNDWTARHDISPEQVMKVGEQ